MRSGKVLFPLIADCCSSGQGRISTGAAEPEPRIPDGAIGSARDENWSRFWNELKLEDFAEADRMTPAPSHVGYWFFYIISRLTL